MKKIECIILDWAGTAVDYGCFAPVAAFIESFNEIGVPVTAAETRAYMGLTKIEEISGKSRALLPLSPLRTVRESFPSYGSSNSIFLFVVRNRLILSTVSFISLVAVVMDKLPYN